MLEAAAGVYVVGCGAGALLTGDTLEVLQQGACAGTPDPGWTRLRAATEAESGAGGQAGRHVVCGRRPLWT